MIVPNKRHPLRLQVGHCYMKKIDLITMVHTKTVGTRKQQNSEKKWACDLGILIQPYNIITQLDQYSIVSGLLKHVIA